MQKKVQRFLAKIYLAILGLLLISLPGQAGAYVGGNLGSGLGEIRPSFSFSSLSSATDLNDLIRRIINIVLTVVGGIAVLFLIVGGFWYLTSGGNEEQAEKGKKTIMNALIGIVVIILSYVIVNVIANLVTSY